MSVSPAAHFAKRAFAQLCLQASEWNRSLKLLGGSEQTSLLGLKGSEAPPREMLSLLHGYGASLGARCVTSENCCPNSIVKPPGLLVSVLLEGVGCAHGLALLEHGSKPLSLRLCLASGSDFFHLSHVGFVVLTLFARTEGQSLERLWHSIDSMATESPTGPVTAEPAHDCQSRKRLLAVTNPHFTVKIQIPGGKVVSWHLNPVRVLPEALNALVGTF